LGNERVWRNEAPQFRVIDATAHIDEPKFRIVFVPGKPDTHLCLTEAALFLTKRLE
jgi:hypothetical protein